MELGVPELLGKLDLLGLQVLLVHQETQVIQDLLDQGEHKALKELPDHQERLGPLAYQESQAHLEAA